MENEFICSSKKCDKAFKTREEVIEHKLTDHLLDDDSEEDSVVSLSNQNLSSFDCSHLENVSILVELDISHNQISNLDALSMFPSLEKLNASRNRLTDLDFAEDLNSLVDLNVEFNRIESILPLKGLKIATLKLKENKLCYKSVIEVLETLNLVELSIEGNEVDF